MKPTTLSKQDEKLLRVAAAQDRAIARSMNKAMTPLMKDPLAKAAPALLRACKGLVEDLEEMQTANAHHLSVERTAEWIANLKRIIAKAEGR